MPNQATIAFVDDDANILNGLRRMLRCRKDDWNMEFFLSGPEALAAMAAKPFDLVVSDMRMPGMDGAQFLHEVQRLYPGTIRVILSGFAESECVLKTIGPAHVYLAKPCDPQELIAAIKRPLALRKHLHTQALHQTLAGVTHLPSLPEVFLAIEVEISSPNHSAASVAAIIGRDVGMTAELLKLTNSAYFALPCRVANPLQAVRILGLETLQTLVLRIGIFRQFGGDAVALRALNNYSLSTAALAQKIALAEGATPAAAAIAHCAGMLSCLGALTLLDSHPAEYRQALGKVGEDLPVHSAEQAQFGASHCLIGAYLLGLWGFSDPLVEAVAHAAEPSNCPGRDNPVLTFVHAARSLVSGFPLLPTGSIEPDGLDKAYLSDLGLLPRIVHWRQIAAEMVCKV